MQFLKLGIRGLSHQSCMSLQKGTNNIVGGSINMVNAHPKIKKKVRAFLLPAQVKPVISPMLFIYTYTDDILLTMSIQSHRSGPKCVLVSLKPKGVSEASGFPHKFDQLFNILLDQQLVPGHNTDMKAPYYRPLF